MTPERFRGLALDLPGSEEGEHMGHPDFRVEGRIFATLVERAERGESRETWGTAMLDLAAQAALLREAPEVFSPGPGAWGRRGATWVRLSARQATPALVRRALAMAWRNRAPERLLAEHAGE